jgi:hypothetical protein
MISTNKSRSALACLLSFIFVTSAHGFVHPGGLHSQADLDRIRLKVAANEHPWIDGWNQFIKDPKAQGTYKARPAADMGSRQRAQDDATAMYYNALRWYISGDTSYGGLRKIQGDDGDTLVSQEQ